MNLNFLLKISVFLIFTVTLLNSQAFGADTLIAYFFYSVLVYFFSAIVLMRIFLQRKSIFQVAMPLACFFLLALYATILGLSKNWLSLTNWYWITNFLFLFSMTAWLQNQNLFSKQKDEINDGQFTQRNIRVTILKMIVTLCTIESIIVILQFLKVFPSPNKYFACTGTWYNPNVIAMFLSLGSFAFYMLIQTNEKSKLWLKILLTITILSILMLQCRSAYLVIFILFIYSQWDLFSGYLKGERPSNYKRIIIGFAVTAIFVLALTNLITQKRNSTNTRAEIIRNGFRVVDESGFWGAGFGMFEKTYNFSTATEQTSSNGHVNMAYNDFLELLIEGGWPALLLWIFCIVLFFRTVTSNQQYKAIGIAVISSFLILQLTNFAISAIPVFVLFLVYMALFTKPELQVKPSYEKVSFFIARTSTVFMVIATFITSFFVLRLMTGFYQKWQFDLAHKEVKMNEIHLKEYAAIGKTITGFSSYHETYGDLLMKSRKWLDANAQYKIALEKSCEPTLLEKLGVNNQQLGLFDSAAYYFTLSAQMQPFKFRPKAFLLDLYVMQNDTTSVLEMARTILDMPAKVKSKRVEEIKNYAKQKLELFTPNQIVKSKGI
jgi:O-antigen polymerase